MKGHSNKKIIETGFKSKKKNTSITYSIKGLSKAPRFWGIDMNEFRLDEILVEQYTKEIFYRTTNKILQYAQQYFF